MVLILLSIILGAIAVTISMIHSSFRILTVSGIAREEIAVPKEQAEQSRVAGQKTRFLVVVLPDGRIVNHGLMNSQQICG
jgi:hypothetical protein